MTSPQTTHMDAPSAFVSCPLLFIVDGTLGWMRCPWDELGTVASLRILSLLDPQPFPAPDGSLAALRRAGRLACADVPAPVIHESSEGGPARAALTAAVEVTGLVDPENWELYHIADPARATDGDGEVIARCDADTRAEVPARGQPPGRQRKRRERAPRPKRAVGGQQPAMEVSDGGDSSAPPTSSSDEEAAPAAPRARATKMPAVSAAARGNAMRDDPSSTRRRDGHGTEDAALQPPQRVTDGHRNAPRTLGVAAFYHDVSSDTQTTSDSDSEIRGTAHSRQLSNQRGTVERMSEIWGVRHRQDPVETYAAFGKEVDPKPVGVAATALAGGATAAGSGAAERRGLAVVQLPLHSFQQQAAPGHLPSPPTGVARPPAVLRFTDVSSMASLGLPTAHAMPTSLVVADTGGGQSTLRRPSEQPDATAPRQTDRGPGNRFPQGSEAPAVVQAAAAEPPRRPDSASDRPQTVPRVDTMRSAETLSAAPAPSPATSAVTSYAQRLAEFFSGQRDKYDWADRVTQEAYETAAVAADCDLRIALVAFTGYLRRFARAANDPVSVRAALSTLETELREFLSQWRSQGRARPPNRVLPPSRPPAASTDSRPLRQNDDHRSFDRDSDARDNTRGRADLPPNHPITSLPRGASADSTDRVAQASNHAPTPALPRALSSESTDRFAPSSLRAPAPSLPRGVSSESEDRSALSVPCAPLLPLPRSTSSESTDRVAQPPHRPPVDPRRALVQPRPAAAVVSGASDSTMMRNVPAAASVAHPHAAPLRQPITGPYDPFSVPVALPSAAAALPPSLRAPPIPGPVAVHVPALPPAAADAPAVAADGPAPPSSVEELEVEIARATLELSAAELGERMWRERLAKAGATDLQVGGHLQKALLARVEETMTARWRLDELRSQRDEAIAQRSTRGAGARAAAVLGEGTDVTGFAGNPQLLPPPPVVMPLPLELLPLTPQPPLLPQVPLPVKQLPTPLQQLPESVHQALLRMQPQSLQSALLLQQPQQQLLQPPTLPPTLQLLPVLPLPSPPAPPPPPLSGAPPPLSGRSATPAVSAVAAASVAAKPAEDELHDSDDAEPMDWDYSKPASASAPAVVLAAAPLTLPLALPRNAVPLPPPPSARLDPAARLPVGVAAPGAPPAAPAHANAPSNDPLAGSKRMREVGGALAAEAPAAVPPRPQHVSYSRWGGRPGATLPLTSAASYAPAPAAVAASAQAAVDPFLARKSQQVPLPQQQRAYPLSAAALPGSQWRGAPPPLPMEPPLPPLPPGPRPLQPPPPPPDRRAAMPPPPASHTSGRSSSAA